MPVSNVSLYGLGKGAAQVIDTTSGAQQGFANLLAKQQAQRQQEIKQLTDQQALLKPDGLRNDADRQDFFNQVQNWRQKSIDAINEKDPYKKSLAQSQAQQAYMQAQQTVSKSKEQGLRDNAFNQFAMNNATRHQLTDDAIQKGLANTKLGVNNPNIITDYSSLGRAPDYEAFDKKNTAFYTKHMNNAVEQDVLGTPITVAGNTMTPWSKVKKIDPQNFAHDVMNEATFNPNYAVALEARYPDLYANAKTDADFHLAHAQAALRLANEQELSKTVNSGFLPQKVTEPQKWELFKKEQLFKQQHPSFTTVQNQQPPAFEHQYVAPIQKGGVGAIQKMVDLAPKNQFRDGEAVKPTVDENGYYRIDIPDQVELKKNGQDLIKANKQAEEDYNKDGGTQGSFWWKKKVPWKESDAYKDLQADEANDPYKVIKKGESIYMNPNDPVDIQTKAAILADRLHIQPEKINAILGGTGKHGLNADVKQQLNQKGGQQSKKLSHGALDDLH